MIPVAVLPGLRPTPDRVRETLFNWIGHSLGTLEKSRVLDLFAGSGALGFEAASRGADSVIMVELHGVALTNLSNVRDAFEASQVDIRSGDALDVAEQLLRSGKTFDLIFLDPPFASDLAMRILPLAAQLCLPSGLIYLESGSAADESHLLSLGLEIYRSDKAGEVFYHLLQRKKED